MANNFDELYDQLSSTERFNAYFTGKEDFQTFINENANSSALMKEMFDVDIEAIKNSEVKKKVQGEDFLSSSPLVGQTQNSPEQVAEAEAMGGEISNPPVKKFSYTPPARPTFYKPFGSEIAAQRGSDVPTYGTSRFEIETKEKAKRIQEQKDIAKRQGVITAAPEGTFEPQVKWPKVLEGLKDEFDGFMLDKEKIKNSTFNNQSEQENTEYTMDLYNKEIVKNPYVQNLISSIEKQFTDNFKNEKEVSGEGVYMKRDRDGYLTVDPAYINSKVDQYFANNKIFGEDAGDYQNVLRQIVSVNLIGKYNGEVLDKVVTGRIGEFQPVTADEVETKFKEKIKEYDKNFLSSIETYKQSITEPIEAYVSKKNEYFTQQKNLINSQFEQGLITPEQANMQMDALGTEIATADAERMTMVSDATTRLNKYINDKKVERSLEIEELGENIEKDFDKLQQEKYNTYKKKYLETLKSYNEEQADANSLYFRSGVGMGDTNLGSFIWDSAQSSMANMVVSSMKLAGLEDKDLPWVNEIVNNLTKTVVGNQYMGRNITDSKNVLEAIGGITNQLIEQVPNIGASIAISTLTKNPYLTTAFMMYTDMAREVNDAASSITQAGGNLAQVEIAKNNIVNVHLMMSPLYFGQGSLLTEGLTKPTNNFLSNYARATFAENLFEIPQEYLQTYTSLKETGSSDVKNADGSFKSFGSWISTADQGKLALEVLPTTMVMGVAPAVTSTRSYRKLEENYAAVGKLLGDKQLTQYVSDMYNIMGRNVALVIPDHLRVSGQINDQEYQELKNKFGSYVQKLDQMQNAGVMDLDKSRLYLYKSNELEKLNQDIQQVTDPVLKSAMEQKAKNLEKLLQDVVVGKDVNLVKFKWANGSSFVMTEEDAQVLLNSKGGSIIQESLTNETRNKKGEAVPMLSMETQNPDLNEKLNELQKTFEEKQGFLGVFGLEQDKEFDSVVADNLTELEAMGIDLGVQDIGLRVQEAKVAQDFLNQRLPGVKIQFLSNDNYKGLMRKIGGNENSNGNFSYAYDPKTKTYKASIQINLENANSKTIAHETSHAILLSMFGEDRLKYEDFQRNIKKFVDETRDQKLIDFVQNYDINSRADEYMAELIGEISNGEYGFKKDLLSKIAEYINKFVSEITAGRIVPFRDVKNSVEVLDFFDSLTQSLTPKNLNQNAVQEQTTGQVPVQPEATTSQEVVQGKPETEPQGVTQEGQTQEPVVLESAQVTVVNENNIQTEQGDILVSGYVNPEEVQTKSQNIFQPLEISWIVDPVSGIRMNVPSERKTMYDVVLESGGAIVIANSDGTGIGKVVDGQTLQGGIGYSFIEENINEEIGFAASDDAKIPSIWEAAQEAARLRDAQNPEMAGKPVAVFVMVQSPAATFGNAYAASYFGNVLKAITKDKNYSTSKAKAELIEFINDFRTKNEIGKKYNDAFAELISVIRNTDFTKAESIDKITDILITEKKRGLPPNTSRELIAENNKRFGFDSRRAFFEKFFVGVGQANSKQPANELRNYLKEKGFGQENFYEKYLDENIIKSLEGETPAKRLQDGGFAMTGFFINPEVSKEDFIKKSKEGTYQHKQFNSKFYGINPFVLNGKYYVNEMFPEASFNASETKGGGVIPVTASAAMSLYPRTRKGQVSDIIERAKQINDILTKSQVVRSEKSSGTTQVATTTGSYVKAANLIKDIKGNVLDYGAGLGLGTDAMSNTLGRTVDSFEPNPERWQGKKEATFTASEQINKKYDAIVSLNVLNVVPKDIRDAIVQDIFDKLNVGGKAVISTRKWTGDVNAAKNAVPGTEEKSLIITRKQGGENVEVFQKGFDGNELVDYIQELLGDKATIVKNTSFGANGVIITKEVQTDQAVRTKSQLDFTQIPVEFQNQLDNGVSELDIYKNLITQGYPYIEIENNLPAPFWNKGLYNQAVADMAKKAIEDFSESREQRQKEIADLMIGNYMLPIEEEYKILADAGYSPVEIYYAFQENRFATMEELEKLFGLEYRDTVSRALAEIADPDFILGIQQDEQTRKMSGDVGSKDLTNVFIEAGLNFGDASVMVDFFTKFLEENGLIEAAKSLRTGLNDIKNDPNGLRQHFSNFAELMSMSGRLLQMARFLFKQNLVEAIDQSLQKNNIILTEKQKETLKRLVSDYQAAQEQHKTALEKLNGDFSDAAYKTYFNSQKALGNAAVSLNTFLNDRKPTFWNDKITSGGSRALLGIPTVILSFVANIENLFYSSNPAARGLQNLRDMLFSGNQLKGNTMSIKNWWLAYKLSTPKSFYDVGMAARYGVTDSVAAVEKYFDGLAQVNFFKDAKVSARFVEHFIKKITGKESWEMTDEEFVDAYNQTLIQMKSGEIELRDGKTYSIARSLFTTLSIGPQLTELTGRAMAFGGDIPFAAATTQRAIIDYLQNVKGTRFQNGIFESLLDNNEKLNKEAIRAISSLILNDEDLRQPFANEGLKRVLYGENPLSKGFGALRSFAKVKIPKLYSKYRFEKNDPFTKGLVLTELRAYQAADVLLWTLMPFLKVPINFLGVAMAKTIPHISVSKYIFSEIMYNRELKSFEKKYKGKIPKGENKLKQYEKDKIELFLKKRQVNYDFAQNLTSSMIYFFVSTAFKSGALLMGGEEEKEKELAVVNLKGNSYNRTLHMEYIADLFAGKDVSNFLARRGGYAKKDDKIVGTNNLGFIGYGMNVWGSIFQKQRDKEQSALLELISEPASLSALIFNEMFNTGIESLPMFQGMARFAELFKEDKTGDKAEKFFAGTISTSLALFSPSLLSFVSKGRGESIQSVNDINVLYEDGAVGEISMRVIQKLNRNVSFLVKNEFYKAAIGPYGEDLMLRNTYAEPGTAQSYIQALWDPFTLRRYDFPTKQAQKESLSYVASLKTNAYLANMLLIYEQLTGRNYQVTFEGKGSNMWTLLSNPMPNEFSYQSRQIASQNKNELTVGKVTFSLPNELYREELKKRGEFRLERMQKYLGRLDLGTPGQFETELDEVTSLVKRGENLQAIRKIEDVMIQFDADLKAVNQSYQTDFSNRAKDIILSLIEKKSDVIEAKIPQFFSVGIVTKDDLKRFGYSDKELIGLGIPID